MKLLYISTRCSWLEVKLYISFIIEMLLEAYHVELLINDIISNQSVEKCNIVFVKRFWVPKLIL